MDQTLKRILKNLRKEYNNDDILYVLGELYQKDADECIEVGEIKVAECLQKKADAVNLAARTRIGSRG